MRGNKGFTLIELLVYIVLAVIIVGLAGRVFFDASAARLRTTRMLETAMGTGDAIAYLQEDIQRMGAKAIMENPSSSSAASSSSAGILGINKIAAVYWDPAATPPDSSSFFSDSVGLPPRRLDTLRFRAATYDPTTRMVTGWEEIQYHVDASANLLRTVLARKDKDGADITPLPAPVQMAEHVVAFQLRFGVQANDSIVFERDILEPCTATSSASSCLIQHTATSASVAANGGVPELGNIPKDTEVLFKLMSGAAPSTFDKFSVVAGATYQVDLGIGNNQTAAENFRADQDLLAMRVTVDGDPTSRIQGTDDVLYYSAMDQNIGTRTFHFTPGVTADANLTLRFHLRDAAPSPMDAAAFRFDKVVVRALADSAYQWRNSFGTSAAELRLKRRVRAVELSISVEVRNSVSTSTKVIPVLNNGV